MNQIDESGRRHYQRVQFATNITLIYSDNEVDVTACSANLSLKGLFVKTQKRVPSGTECKIRIVLSGGIDAPELLINAKIIRVEDEGMGILFESMDIDTYTHLKNIIQYNSINNN